MHPSELNGYILVCDSEPRMASWITELLRAAGYSVEAFTTGQDALARMRQSPPMLLITSDHLPDIEDWEFRRKVRSDTELASMGSLVLFVDDSDYLSRQTLSTNWFEWDMGLVIPFNSLELLACIDRLNTGLAGRVTLSPSQQRTAVDKARRNWLLAAPPL